jgi:hypothetical protein
MAKTTGIRTSKPTHDTDKNGTKEDGNGERNEATTQPSTQVLDLRAKVRPVYMRVGQLE